ncbi:cathelicidin antimicrobial peptide-like [Discoglossus pictus]
MRATWRSLLLLLISSTGLKLWAWPLDLSRDQYASSITQAIDQYIKEDTDTFVYKLWKLDPDMHSTLSPQPQVPYFLLKETVCRKSETSETRECPFKDNGILKVCSVQLSEKEITLRVLCDTATKQHSRSRRSEKTNEKKKKCKRTCNLTGGLSIIASLPLKTKKSPGRAARR